MKYSIYYLNYYIEEGDFIFIEFKSKGIIISNHEDFTGDLALKNITCYIGIKGKILEGINYSDIYKTMSYNPNPL